MKQFTILMFVTFYFCTGSAFNECGKCDCCINGTARCQHYKNIGNYCLEGCFDGYYGDRCIHACNFDIANCLSCADRYLCTKCSVGHYGALCLSCPYECVSCSNSNECQECKDGYYNGRYHDNIIYNKYDDCRYSCKTNCKSCSSYYTCSACKDGYYNGKQYTTSLEEYEDCRHPCYVNCKSCSSYYNCDVCKSGYYTIQYWNNGVKYSNCASQCDSACKSCRSATKCTECFADYYFDSYQEYCFKCNGNCTSCSSREKCNLCIEGKYNSQFEDCRESCKPECISCISSHYCNECVPGRYGTTCQQFCSQGCSHGHCDKNSGNCICRTGFYGDKCERCLTGKYGINCNQSCPVNCLNNDCKNNGICYQCNNGFTGVKCDKCEDGKYGQDCTTECPNGCENNTCTRDGACYSCKTGWRGQFCRCSHGCDSDSSCSSNGYCSSCKKGFTGDKCDECIDGKFGNNCDHRCPLNCLACISLVNCSACVERHWGASCQPCDTNCLNCSSSSTCFACLTGFHGPTCHDRCNEFCLGIDCNQLTGICNEGCNDGFYGNICNESCNPNCMNSICDRVHGDCSEGCKAGYNGLMCTEYLGLKKDDNDSLSVIIGASAGGGVLLILFIIALLVVVLLMKRRRNRSKHENNDLKGINSGSDTMTYSEINDVNMTTERNYDDHVRTNTESVAYSSINDELSAAKDQEIGDALYAKPIKPKKKAQVIMTSTGSSTAVTVNNPNYEKPEYKTINKGKENKPSIASKPIQIDDKNAVRKSNTKIEAMNGYYDENVAALEIEEDIESLSKTSKSVILEENARIAAAPDLADTYYNVGALKKRKIKLDQISHFVANKTKRDFADEFQTLPAMLIKPYVESQKRENLSKNRYKGIYPYDDTRVVLKNGDSDYINASYVDGYNKSKAYIASIGPTTKYMGDMSAFWIMVWQEEVGKIVMLTNLIEGGVPKCDRYWPEKNSSLTFANIQVTCQTEEEYSDYTFRSFIVKKDLIKRNIVQVHFTAWPDKGTPDDVTSLIEFREKVNRTKTDLNGPILVHCSAGIGRTGTYIALDSVTKEGEAEGEVDIFAFVRNMREQRVNMIQTAEQYQYLHNAIVHTLTFESKAIQACKFSEYMKSHSKDNIGKMFEKLQASVEQRSDDEKEAVKRNKALTDKNKEGADISGDRNRPKLYMYMLRKPGSSDYINALYVNSFKSVNRYLIAQTPLPETVEDFLTLIIQEKVSCIISMVDISTVDKNIGIYCPADNQTLKKGAFAVNTERENGTDQYMLRKMKISHNSKFGSEEVTFPHVQFTPWGNDKLTPEDPIRFVQFVRQMELKFYGTDPKRPILVHCSTGASRSGLFCAVSTLLEKAQIDQEVSVMNTVRQIKHRRHMAIPNKEQYIFCHFCVNEYMRTFETYSNFELKS